MVYFLSYLRLSQTKVRYREINRAILGNLDLSQAIMRYLGYHWLSVAIKGYLWLSLVIPGYLRLSLSSINNQGASGSSRDQVIAIWNFSVIAKVSLNSTHLQLKLKLRLALFPFDSATPPPLHLLSRLTFRFTKFQSNLKLLS